MRLVKASLEAPAGLLDMYRELGDGEQGFLGQGAVAAGTLSVSEHLRLLVEMSEGRGLPDGWVPMTTSWLLDEHGAVAGMSRLRHRLTPRLLIDGGNIGYYVRPAYRGRGYGTKILELTLLEARKLGLERVLLTVLPDNEPSVRIIEGRGGVLEDERRDPESGEVYRRYWIDLT